MLGRDSLFGRPPLRRVALDFQRDRLFLALAVYTYLVFFSPLRFRSLYSVIRLWSLLVVRLISTAKLLPSLPGRASLTGIEPSLCCLVVPLLLLWDVSP